MVVRVGADDLGLLAQGHATLDEGFFEKFDLLEVVVGYSFIG